MKEPHVVMSLRVPPEIHAAIERHAARSGVTMGDVVTRAIELYLSEPRITLPVPRVTIPRKTRG